MSDSDLQNAHHNIDPTTWWYEEPSGICIVKEIRDSNDGLLRTEQFTILWRSIRAALKRKDGAPDV